MTGQMFLRTAQTEARIDALEAAVRRIEERLKLEDDDVQGASDAPGEAVDPKGNEIGNGEGAAGPRVEGKGSRSLPRKSVAERVARGAR